MSHETKVRVDNVEYDAREVDFEIVHEDWNEYNLLDGGRVRIKTNVQKIFRILDPEGKPANTADGDPHIVVRHSSIVTTTR